MPYVLGLDIGARSVGWALLEKEGDSFTRILRAGVRVFEAGTEGDIEQGRDESRGATRRAKRLARRQIRRRRQRARALYRELSGAGLLPPITPVPGSPMAVLIQEAINRLDCELRRKYAGERAVNQLPYLLRARALDHRLEPHELGRALYHLGQRRGFKSNRKAESGKKAMEDSSKAGEEKSLVYRGIDDLKRQIREAGARTLGEYFATLDPAEQRIRTRYTHRSMYEEEFEAIWEAQRRHHAALTRELKDRLWQILFEQRPLRDTEDLVGECAWIPGEKRAPVWSLDYQRYRVLQTVNHLRVAENRCAPRPLTHEERWRLLEELEKKPKVTIAQAKKLLGLKKAEFTIEEGGEKELPGDKVAAQFYEKLGESWSRLNPEERRALVECVATAETDEQLSETLQQQWGLSADQANKVVREVHLPSGYAPLSLKAIRAVMPYLEQGMDVQRARLAAGIPLDRPVSVHALLPPVADSRVAVFNPAVKRALTEMRKVVNAIIRRYGKPDEIHLETARELRKSREERMKESRRMRDREKEREEIIRRIRDEVGIPEEKISRDDVLKGLLWQECEGRCPYCGESLGGFASLFGGNSPAQIEHIIPFSRSLDNSFVNLTLAHVSDNAYKGDRTPREAYGSDPERWDEILQRVEVFKGSYSKAKLNRFKMDESAVGELFEQFSSRALNDTRASAVAAARYLSLLYGGETVDGKRKILKVTGQVTAYLRDVWGLNGLIPSIHREARGEAEDGQAEARPVKSRDDHRHHAVDAVVVALCNQGWIQRLSEANRGALAARRRLFAPVEPPWVGFKEQLKDILKSMNISFRPDHRVTGALHKETFYTRIGKNEKGGDVVRVRVPVTGLGSKDVEAIADPAVRAIVRAKLEEVGGNAKKLENNWPLLPNRNGKPVPIKKVRVNLNRAVVSVGKGRWQRWAEPSETHHIEIYEVTSRGKTAWSGDVVTMRDAIGRASRGEPVVRRDGGPNSRFLFSLAKEDTLRLQGEKPGIWVVKKIRANTQMMLVPQYDARKEKDSSNGRESFSPTPGGLQKYSAEKVLVLPIGDVVRCNE